MMDTGAERIHFNELSQYDATVSLHDAVIIIGAPFKNQSNPDKLFISPTLFSNSKIVYEIERSDVLRWEEMDNIVDSDGRTVYVIKLYVRRGAHAVKYEPIILQ